MNKAYLVSLVGYLMINTTIFVLLSLVLSNPITLGNFLFTTAIAVVIHKYMIYNRNTNENK
jgi:Na+/H+ antiporter NhaB